MIVCCLFVIDTATTDSYAFCHTSALHAALPFSPAASARRSPCAPPPTGTASGWRTASVPDPDTAVPARPKGAPERGRPARRFPCPPERRAGGQIGRAHV